MSEHSELIDLLRSHRVSAPPEHPVHPEIDDRAAKALEDSDRKMEYMQEVLDDATHFKDMFYNGQPGMVLRAQKSLFESIQNYEEEFVDHE